MMILLRSVSFLLLALALTGIQSEETCAHFIKSAPEDFMLGNEALISDPNSPLQGKRIGMVTNNSGVTSDGRLFLDLVSDHHTVTKIFTPEHGLRGDERNDNYMDERTGAYVVSLYGTKSKPDSDDLSDVDILVYDLQDVAARFYTFINTLYYCMESAAENGKPFIVCDRPVIPPGDYVDGFMLDEGISSFVGMINVPVSYAMTCGELALFLNDKYFGKKCDLRISGMKNYRRGTDYNSLTLYWKTPSPNMYFPESAVAYLGTCLFEGTNISEGRGSDRPFEYIGAPFIDGYSLAEELSRYGLEGIEFSPVRFTPRQIMSWMAKPKYADEECGGVYMKVTDKSKARPFRAAVAILVTLQKLYPGGFVINSNNFIDKLSGTTRLRTMLSSGDSYENIVSSYNNELSSFKELRKKYLLYQ